MRSRGVFVGAVVVTLLLASCASSRSSVAPTVGVVISAEDAVRRLVNTAKFREVTEWALRKYAAEAGRATLTVRFDSLGAVDAWAPQLVISSQPSSGRSVPILSAEPWNEPGRPMVGVGGSSFIPMRVRVRQAVVRGTYTITDANGAVLEQKPVAIPPNYGDGMTDRLAEQRATAAHLAKRVAKLVKKERV